MKQLSQEESNEHWKRLKSLDEPASNKKQIASKKQLDAIMEELYKESKTYEHNTKIIPINTIKKKPSIIKRIGKTILKTIKFCFKAVAYFIVGYIVLAILILILKTYI